MPTTCEGLFDFEKDLLFHADALGSSVAATVGGISAELLLPNAPRRGTGVGFEGALQPPATRIALKPTPDWKGLTWGMRVGLPSGICIVHTVALRVAVQPDDEAAIAQFAKALVPWFDCVCEWLSATTEQDISGTRARPRSLGPPILLTAIDEKGEFPKVAQYYPPLVGRAADEDAAIKLDVWQRALHEASRSRSPPLPHRLLNEARAALHRWDTRTAVIAAGSAAEVALNEAIRMRLGPTNEAGAIDLILDNKTLGRLPKIAADFGIACPDLGALTGPRNGAVHRGLTPNDGETREAFSIARTVVEMHSRLW
jgi:hypothetical protein